MKDLCVLLLLCCVKVTKTEVFGSENAVLGVVGDDLILPCYLENSVSAVDMEVEWSTGGRLVHHYQRHQDLTDEQDKSYKGRTHLSRDELLRGNISLKLTAVTVSDTNIYRCMVRTARGSSSADIHVKVESALGNQPVIFEPVSHKNGSATLDCKSTNWTSTPKIEWLDSTGKILEHARNPNYCHDINKTLYVQRSVTVQEKDGYSYTCRVSYLNHMKEAEINVPRSYFAQTRSTTFRLLSKLIPLVVFVIVILVPYYQWSQDVPEVLGSENAVLGVVGDDLILPCYLKNSVSAVDMEVEWSIGRRLVHHYKNCQDLTDEQDEDYKGRTHLSRDELLRGNISLKLTAVTASDTNIYRCMVKTARGSSSAVIEVKVNVIGEYKQNLISGFKKYDSYTDLRIIHGHKKVDTRKKVTISKKDIQGIAVDELFKRDGSLAPNVVILEGEAGHGKSFTVQKIMHDWASKEHFVDQFDLILLLRCDELSVLEQTNSLLDLVNSNQTYRSKFEQIFKDSPHKVLFLIDGFDEISFSEEDMASSPEDPFKPARAKAVLCGLLRGSILPESFLLITTRPSVPDRLISLVKEGPKRFAKIQGFTKQGVKDYFNKAGLTSQFQSVEKTEVLLTFCFNPILCWIICQILKRNPGKIEPPTITSIFFKFVTIIIKKDDKRESLSKLCELAKAVIEDGKVLFDLEDSNLQDCGIFRCIDIGKEKKFSFIHQSLVEFFAALRYTMIADKKTAQSEVDKLLISAQSEHSKPHVQPVLKFLFGLSNEDVRKALSNTFGPLDSTLQAQLKQWLLNRSQICNIQNDLFFPYCLYELHKDEFIKEAMCHWKSISLSRIPLARIDCSVLRHCLGVCPSIKQLDLRFCNLTPETRELLKPVWETLRCDKLSLSDEDLTGTDIEELISCLEKGILSSTPEQNEQKQKAVNVKFLSVKSFSLQTASSLFKILQKRNIIPSVSLEEHKEAPDADVCSSISVQRDSEDFMITVGYQQFASGRQQAGPTVSSICLVLPESEGFTRNWIQFLQTAKSQRQDISLLEHLCTADLKRLEIELDSLTDIWVYKILGSIRTFPSLQKIKVWVDDKKNMHGSIFSSLTLRREIGKDTFRLKAKDSSDESSVCLIVPVSEVSSPDKSADLLNMILTLRGLQESNSEEVDEPVVPPTLSQVDNLELKINCISVSLAEIIINSCCNSSLDEISFYIETPAGTDMDGVCTSLTVRIKESTFWLKLMDGRICLSPYTAPALSGISLLSKEIPHDMNWRPLIRAFSGLRSLTTSIPHVVERVGDVLSLLGNLPKLTPVELYVSCLSDGLANGIMSIIEEHPSWPKATVICGMKTFNENKREWVLRSRYVKEGRSASFSFSRKPNDLWKS